MTKTMPNGCVLADDVAEAVVLGYGYQHWTVADVIEMLQEQDPEARVWVTVDWGDEDDSDIVIRPLETLYGADGEVFL